MDFNKFRKNRLGSNLIRSFKGGAVPTCYDEGINIGNVKDSIDDVGCTYYYKEEYEKCDDDKCN